ncbi:hypothetical protein GBAR_LOCUS12045 [Geodia barretti]|uniref:Uncharacterized protein n=1 Tax=Geodia barretti TaxID=519541 RepID=A0AA35RYJ9_GEOBA|nr:hypothetical protein GBAR_LOCUS12045 [Geodia barretti]
MGDHTTAAARPQTSAVPQSGTPAAGRPQGADWHSVRTEERHPLGDAAPRDGLWFRDDLLAPAAGLAASRSVAEAPRNAVVPIARCGPPGLIPGLRGQRVGAGRGWRGKRPAPSYGPGQAREQASRAHRGQRNTSVGHPDRGQSPRRNPVVAPGGGRAAGARSTGPSPSPAPAAVRRPGL